MTAELCGEVFDSVKVSVFKPMSQMIFSGFLLVIVIKKNFGFAVGLKEEWIRAYYSLGSYPERFGAVSSGMHPTKD